MVNAIVLMNAERGRVAAVAEQVAAVPGVSEVFSVAGRVDLVAMIRVSTNEELADVVTKHFAALQGIEHTETLIAFRVYSREEIEGVFGIGLDRA